MPALRRRFAFAHGFFTPARRQSLNVIRNSVWLEKRTVRHKELEMDLPSRYREDAVQQILKRAMALDQERGDTISDLDIHAIGAELGITRTSVEQALLEVNSPVGGSMQRILSGRTRWKTHPASLAFAGGGLLALTFQLLQALGAGGFVAFGALVGALGGAVGLATLYKGIAKHERFQFANIALWVGFMIPLGVMDGPGLGQMLEGLAPYALMSGIAGSAAIMAREFVARFGGSDSDEQGHQSFAKRTIRAIRAAAKAWKGAALLRERSA